MFKILGEKNELFVSIAKVAFKVLELKGKASVEVVIVSEEEIRQTNKANREIDAVTDVLSFPTLTEILPFSKKNYPYEYDKSVKAVSVGSIMICEARAREQAEEYGHSETRENAYLFLHGLLHLMGYDHINDKLKAQMRAKEEEILGMLKILR